MRLSIIGSGYVGTTVAACFTDLGHDVVNIDIDGAIVEAINAGELPIHGEGLPELLAEHAGVDSCEVADGIGLDDRIGDRFLRSGVGWGGCRTQRPTARAPNRPPHRSRRPRRRTDCCPRPRVQDWY